MRSAAAVRAVNESGIVSEDTVKRLEEMLQEARSGRLVGLACATIHRQDGIQATIAGEAYRNPVFTRGMIACLDDEARAIMGRG